MIDVDRLLVEHGEDLRQLAKAAAPGCCRLHPGAEIGGEEAAFARLVDRYKRRFGRPYPTSSEVLALAKIFLSQKTEVNRCTA